MIDIAAFFFVALFGLSSLVMMLRAKNIMHSAIYLALFFTSTSLIFALMGAVLLGIIQFLVFVGGIVVLVVVAIMLGGGELNEKGWDIKKLLLCALFLIGILPYLPTGNAIQSFTFEQLSQAFAQYGLLAVISGLILFSSLVAAIYLLRRD